MKKIVMWCLWVFYSCVLDGGPGYLNPRDPEPVERIGQHLLRGPEHRRVPGHQQHHRQAVPLWTLPHSVWGLHPLPATQRFPLARRWPVQMCYMPVVVPRQDRVQLSPHQPHQVNGAAPSLTPTHLSHFCHCGELRFFCWLIN